MIILQVFLFLFKFSLSTLLVLLIFDTWMRFKKIKQGVPNERVGSFSYELMPLWLFRILSFIGMMGCIALWYVGDMLKEPVVDITVLDRQVLQEERIKVIIRSELEDILKKNGLLKPQQSNVGENQE